MAKVMTRNDARGGEWRSWTITYRREPDVRAAVLAAGGEVVGEGLAERRCAGARHGSRPDVAICAVGLPDGDGVSDGGGRHQHHRVPGRALHQSHT
jgi:hypothetical protein